MRWSDRLSGRLGGVVRAFEEMPQRLEQLQAQALVMQEQALAMHGAQEAGGSAWDPVALRPPPSDFVKRGTCGSCGAAKELPSVREHLYCDFCGQLTDYDLERATQAAAQHPSVQTYATIANGMAPRLSEAVRRGDRGAHLALQHELVAAQAAHTPWSVPPRAWNDPRFRERWVGYTAAVTTAAAFDPTQVRHADTVRERSLRLQWNGGMGLGVLGGTIASVRRLATGQADLTTMTPTAVAASFWPLADAVMAQNEDLLELIRREGLDELDPDAMSPATRTRLTRSMLVQGWLRHLEPDDGQAFIERMELRHEYQRATVHEPNAACGGCGLAMTVLPGATQVVCDACGRPADAAAPQAVCTGCGGRVCFLVGETHQHCPHCAAELRRV